jgi:dienelactone hydrolase
MKRGLSAAQIGCLRRWRGVVAVTVLCFLTVLGIFFGREIASLAYIAFVRGADAAHEAVRSPILERSFDDVVAANTGQTVEIEAYLDRLSEPAQQSAESFFDFSSEADYLRSREKMRALLATSLAYPPPHVLPASQQTASLAHVAEDGLASYYELIVPVLRGVHARGVFMMPRAASGKVPLVIAAHGRGGMPERPKDGKLTVVSRRNRDLAYGALQKGYAVWEPMFIFYSQQHPADIRERLEVRARQSGTTLPAIEIAKIIGGLNALLASQPIDAKRIAMVGMSYGGFYTLYATALEDRIRVAVVAAYFNDRKAVLASSEPFGVLDWRFHNSLRWFRDETMAALICPRPLQIQSGDHDQLFPIEGARQTVPAARRFYERLNIADRFSFVEFVGRHDFNGDAAWTFIDRFFSVGAGVP